MTVPVAIAPPAHMEISAVAASRRSSSCSAVVISRVPVRPDRVAEGDRAAVDVDPVQVGPVLTAAQDSTIDANASLTSNRSMSPMRHAACARAPARSPRSGRRGGSTARRRSGTGPRSGPAAAARAAAARSASMSSTAEAPSLICDEVPAVCRPPGEHRLEPGQRLQAGLAQSLVPVDHVSPVAALSIPGYAPRARNGPRPGDLGLGSGTRRPNASRSARESPRRCAMRSAATILARHVDVPGSRPGRARVSPGRHVAPSGTRLIASTPHAIPTPIASAAISPVTRCAACCAEPHCASSVRQPVVCGSPACSQAVLVMLFDCSPAWVTQPPDYLLDLGRRDARPVDQRRLHAAQDLGRVHAGQHRRRACRPGSVPPRRSPRSP